MCHHSKSPEPCVRWLRPEQEDQAVSEYMECPERHCYYCYLAVLLTTWIWKTEQVEFVHLTTLDRSTQWEEGTGQGMITDPTIPGHHGPSLKMLRRYKNISKMSNSMLLGSSSNHYPPGRKKEVK